MTNQFETPTAGNDTFPSGQVVTGTLIGGGILGVIVSAAFLLWCLLIWAGLH